jgi:hypothetical protein
MIYFPGGFPGKVVVMLVAEDLRSLFTAVLPGELIDELAVEFNLVERDRKVEIRSLVRALILSASTPDGGRQADALRAYLEMNVADISRAAFYKRFDERLERLMGKLAERAMAHAASLEVDLPGILGEVTDWYIVDSETAKLRGALKTALPGCGDYAAIKVHKTISVGTGAPVRYHFSPAKEHDSKHLDIDESWRGYGLLADLGYASLARLRACIDHGVAFVIRLKENWKPKVDYIARGLVTKTFLAGSDLDALIEDDVLVLDDKAVDMDVKVGPEGRQLALRLVGIPTSKGHCFFLTNLPARIGPWQVGDMYRVRWEIELSMKLDKSIHRLDESKATKACSVKTMLHASLLASTITAIAVHLNHLKTRPEPGTARSVAPFHPMQVARVFHRQGDTIAYALEMDEAGAQDEAETAWEFVAQRLNKNGVDPNWRRRPSTLDVLRGTKKSPPRKGARPRSHAKPLLK